MAVGIKIDQLLYDFLEQQALLNFAPILARESITKLDHLEHVKDDELSSYGLSSPAIRRLRVAFLNKDLQKKLERRKRKKKEIKYVDISNLEEFKRPTPEPTPTQLIQPTFVDQNRMPTPTNEETPSTSSQLSLIMKDDIKLMEGLGEGTFAVVKKAIWNKNGHEKIDVAVKIIREATEEVKQDLMNEIKLMSKLRHPNLIQLYGVVLGDPMLMVLEFCDGGALLDRLRAEDKPVLLATQLMNYSQQIASGMTHLEQKGYVHRDLATRNVLLAKNEQQIKICDFGLSRVVDENNRLYNMQTSKKVPFSWCPPESLRYRRFSSASDVWAFGVTLWELWTNGEEPWIGYGALKVLEAAERGERLRRPENAPNNVYDIMYSCWALKPEERPDFTRLYQLLSAIKFDTVEIKADFFPTIPAHIEVKIKQRFIILEERSPTLVHGQNVATRKYGLIPKDVLGNKAAVTNNMPLQPIQQQQQSIPMIKPIRQAPTPVPKHQQSQLTPTARPGSVPLPITKPMVQNRSEISLIPNSIIHAGHGDSDWSKSWGDPQKIPEVYLKNPVTKPVIGTDPREGITLAPQPNIPTKPSLPKNPPNHLAGSVPTPFANKDMQFSSIEQWNKSRMSADVGLMMTAKINNNSPKIHVNKPVENVTMRQQPIETNQRPKTTIGGPSIPNHHAKSMENGRKITMEERQREREAFQWIPNNVATNKQFVAAKNTTPKLATQNGNGEDRNYPVPVSVLRKDEPKENWAKESTLMQPKSMPSISTSFSTEQSKPLQSTGFSPRSNGGHDPFEVPEEAKSLISRPFTSFFNDQQQVQKTNNLPPPLPSSNPPNLNVATTTTLMKMDPSPIQRPFHTLGKVEAKSVAHNILKNAEQRNGTILTTPQQVERVYPSLDELMYPDRSSNSFQNGRTNGGMGTQTSWLSPTSSLLLNDPNRTDITRPRPTSVVGGSGNFSTMRMITNGTVNGGTQQLFQQPQIQQNTLPLTELPRKRVVPGTAPPSAPVVDHLIAMLTTPIEQQKQPVGWDPDVVGRSSLIQSNLQAPNSPRTSVMPTPNTATIVANNTATAPTNTVSVNISNAEKILAEVRKQVPSDTNVEDIKKALIKHNLNGTMAVKELKVQKLLALNFTKDPCLAASALDACNWDLDQAANRLLS